MRRALLVVAVLLVGPVALAQGVSGAAGAKAVVQAARTWSESEILSMFSAPVRKPLSWGRAVRYGGAAVFAASLIYGALDWFYETAKQSTGTPLDDWYAGSPTTVRAFQIRLYQNPVWNPNNPEALRTLTWQSGVGTASWTNLKNWQATTTTPITEELWTAAYAMVSAAYGAQGGTYVTSAGQYVTPSFCGDVGYICRGYLSLERTDLGSHLGEYSASRDALRNRVVPDYLSSVEQGSGFPYTYGEPYGPGAGVVLDPAPNRNQWYDNPAANPNLDTDGDGFTDWEEWQAGTDPNNPNSRPSVSPNPSRDSDGDGWSDQEEVSRGTDPDDPASYPEGEAPELPEPGPDRDGDGLADAEDPCPFDALNRCLDNGGREEDPIEFPDDYAREGTLQGIASDTGSIRSSSERTAAAAEGILDALEGEGEVTGEVTFPELAEAWAGVLAQLEASLEAVRVAAQGKVLFQGVIPQLAVSGGGSCDEISITLLGINRQLGWCDSVFYTLLTTWARNGLALLMLIGFAFASARTVGAL